MEFHLYGLIIGLLVVASALVATRLLRPHGLEEDHVWDATMWVVGMGVVGARLYHVISEWEIYRTDIVNIFYIWKGGLGIFGAIVGGLLGLGIYSIMHSRREDVVAWELFLLMADVAVIMASLGQMIGRLGNYFNNELFGTRTNLRWGMAVEGLEGRYHPLFVYEGILDLILFICLLLMFRRPGYVKGQVLGGYLMGYGVVRIMLEGFRWDHWILGGVNMTYVVGGLFAVIGTILLRRRVLIVG